MAASSSLSRRRVGKLIVRLSIGSEKRRVRSLTPYYEPKTNALPELDVAQIGPPEYGEDEDMDESINTNEARDSLLRGDWLSSGQESVEFTGGI